MSAASCVLGNPIFQYAGGVLPRAHVCLWRDIACLCELIESLELTDVAAGSLEVLEDAAFV